VSDVEWCGYFTIVKNTVKHAVMKGTVDVDENFGGQTIFLRIFERYPDELNRRLWGDL